MSPTGVSSKLWFATLWLLPVTTPPFLPFGQTVAKPLSIVPVTLTLLIVFLFGSRRTVALFSREALLLYAFCIMTIAGFGYFTLTSLSVDEASLGNYLRGFLALVVGVIFYLAFRSMNLTDGELRKSEKIILIAMSLSIGVAFLQFVTDKYFSALLPLVTALNYAFVDVADDWSGRYHGLAYEPSWLASQITLLMLPLILSRWVTGQTLGIVRLGLVKIRYETLFLWIAVIGVILSGSRTAFVSTVVILVVVLLSSPRIKNRKILTLAEIRRRIAILVVGAIVALGSLSNEYVYSMVRGFGSDDLIEFAQITSSAPRVSAWVSGLEVFEDNPVVGVGLGNAFSHYQDNVPDWALPYPEVQLWLTDPSARPNPKNMLVKLLAETGLLGFGLFCAFVLAHFRSGSLNPRYLVLRNAAVVALLFNYFSLDSFALPTEWFLLGFVLLSGRETVQTRAKSARTGLVYEN